MNRSRTFVAALAILALIGATLVPAGALLFAVLFVAVLLFPLTPAVTPFRVVAGATHADPLARTFLLLRAPPATSIQR